MHQWGSGRVIAFAWVCPVSAGGSVTQGAQYRDRPPHRFLRVAPQCLVQACPFDSAGFFADPYPAFAGDQQEADVPVRVLRRVIAGRNAVGVQVEDSTVQQRDAAHPGFLERFAQCGVERGFPRFAVPAGLQPLVQLRVMHQEEARARSVGDESRSGNMARGGSPGERFRDSTQERQEAAADVARARRPPPILEIGRASSRERV